MKSALCVFRFACMFLFSVLLYGEHVALLIKMPTRGRLESFFFALDQYYEKLSHQNSFHFVISCDLDDPIMNSEETILKLKTYPNLSYYFSNNRSKIEACNNDMENHMNFDVLMLASDDMLPIVQAYDEIIISSMKKHFPNYDGALHFNDGFKGESLNTLAVLGKNYYRRFNYIYHPDYASLFCDDEYTIVGRMLNKLVYIDQVIIEHRHFTNGKACRDGLYERNEQFSYKDYETFLRRKKINFEIPL